MKFMTVVKIFGVGVAAGWAYHEEISEVVGVLGKAVSRGSKKVYAKVIDIKTKMEQAKEEVA